MLSAMLTCFDHVERVRQDRRFSAVAHQLDKDELKRKYLASLPTNFRIEYDLLSILS